VTRSGGSAGRGYFDDGAVTRSGAGAGWFLCGAMAARRSGAGAFVSSASFIVDVKQIAHICYCNTECAHNMIYRRNVLAYNIALI
jgi:hypothetical protein